MPVDSGINATNYFWLLQILCFIHTCQQVINSKFTEGYASAGYINSIVN